MQAETKEVKKNKFQDDDPDEEWYLYDKRKAGKGLNSDGSVFDKGSAASLDTAKSVFDRGAVFMTTGDNRNEQV